MNGAIFGLAYYEVARRSSRDRRRLALELALAEHMTLFSTGRLVDRYHPARGEPGVEHVFSAPAFAQATVRHAIFGVVLGRLGTENGSPGAGEEAGLEQERHQLGVGNRLAVEALDREALPALRLHVLDEGRECGPQPLLVGLAERDDRAPTALDEERCLAAEEDDVRACDAGSPAAGRLRPGQRGSVRLCGIGRGEHERIRLLALLGAELTEPLDRAAERELGSAETLDEVAAPREPERLERLQLAVDGAVPADDPLAADAVAGDDPLPLEEQLGQSTSIRDLSGARRRTWLEETGCRATSGLASP